MRGIMEPGVIVSVLLGAFVSAALDPVYIGRWKLNAEKTFAGLSFVETQSNEIRTRGDVVPSAIFRLDGKDYPAGGGVTTAWVRIDAHTWMAVHKFNGQIGTTDQVTLSPDERTLTIVRTGSRPEAGAKFVLARESGSTGLIGDWRATAVTIEQSVLELSPFGDDGLSIRLMPGNEVFNLKFDGRDAPIGTNVPEVALAFRQTGPRSFDVIQKQNGKTMATTSYVVSDDGKTLSVVSLNEESRQTARAIYDRQ